MPTARANGIDFSYDETGDRSKPTIVFTHSLLWDWTMFADVVADLADEFHIVNLDQHGHGGSGFRAPLDLDEMAADYAVLLDVLGLDTVHWAGLSMGGMTGMRLALARPEKICSLVLMDTSAQPEMEERRESYHQLAGALRAGLAGAVADQILPFYFSPATYREQPDLIAAYRSLLASDRPYEGIYQAAVAVFTRRDISPEIERIPCPTLVIVGEADIATPPDRARLIADRVPNATLVTVADAGHMSATEKPREVARAMREFLTV